MNTEHENRMEDYYKNHEPNPCRNCPNYEVEVWEGGTDAFCILGGGENCDREEGGQ